MDQNNLKMRRKHLTVSQKGWQVIKKIPLFLSFLVI